MIIYKDTDGFPLYQYKDITSRKIAAQALRADHGYYRYRWSQGLMSRIGYHSAISHARKMVLGSLHCNLIP
jgi:hypothetical protein